jgi:DNA replication protein DnaC
VPLTEAEMQAAQDAARQAKWQSIKNAQYAWDVSYPTPKQPWGYERMLAAKLAEAEAQGLHYEGAARQALEQLAWYFNDDSHDYDSGSPAAEDLPNPDKGLLLAGPVGCGKTTVLRLFMRNPVQKFGVVSARTVASAYQTKGAPGLEPYLTAHHTGGVVFDDLGTEATSVQHFGTSCNPMAEVLLARYDEFQAGRLLGIYTHLTTNLPVGEASDAPGTLSLYGLYGQRVVDRIREMFTLIAFDPNSPSQRR